jgi:anti-sigma regulatory factor (Ser/Thr protein kinase)
MLLAVTDQSQVASARRASTAIATQLGFNEEKAGRVGIIATEMATNMLKHATGGHLAISTFADGSGEGIEITAADKGPGIADVSRALQDGYSSVGTPGTGLGAIRRQADQFEIFSRPGLGSIVMARIGAERPRKAGPTPPVPEIGVALSPFPGETECGDDWRFAATAAGPTLLAVDGSGHGPLAAIAARTAAEAFERNSTAECVAIVEAIHRALAPTRGAAVAVARIDAAARVVRFVGVGNIAAALVADGAVKRMVSHNGTAGHVAPRIREFTYGFCARPTIVLHSDGISAKWDFDAYPGLAASHPSIIAAALCRDHRRSNDDVMAVVMRAAA